MCHRPVHMCALRMFFFGALTEVEWHYANSHAMHAPPIDINQNSQCPLGQHSALWRASCTLESPKKPGKHIYVYIYIYKGPLTPLQSKQSGKQRFGLSGENHRPFASQLASGRLLAWCPGALHDTLTTESLSTEHVSLIYIYIYIGKGQARSIIGLLRPALHNTI